MTDRIIGRENGAIYVSDGENVRRYLGTRDPYGTHYCVLRCWTQTSAYKRIVAADERAAREARIMASYIPQKERFQM